MLGLNYVYTFTGVGTSGPSVEEQDANTGPPKKTAAKWGKAMKTVKISAAAKLKEAADEAKVEAEAAAAQTGEDATAKTLSRSKSQPHDASPPHAAS